MKYAALFIILLNTTQPINYWIMQSYDSGYCGKESIQDVVKGLNMGTQESFLSKLIVSTRDREQRYAYMRGYRIRAKIFIGNKNAICPTKII